ncbi:FKBP-type peptidyl-prolyl cis-trans isomerase [Allosphingosinicella sp.]|jgi:FKBP-type peptidyl-prolyl cis-trans isomerase FkpA|uniref:FKBP-type peptidyl-prolyl cis-trans isomerase n=1 Tax=Allosphingosinicella sp. TaxID=2823234 RepID=UPI002EFF4B48
MPATAVPPPSPRRSAPAFYLVGLFLLAALAAAAAWASTGRLHFATTESGLQYRVIEAGDGPSPGAGDWVLVNYTGRLRDGTEFDSSQGRGPVPMQVSGVVPGFSEALMMMSKGSTYQVRIPPQLGYGARASGAIPPNSELEFDIELVDFRTLTPEEVQQMQMQMMMQQGGGPPPEGPR